MVVADSSSSAMAGIADQEARCVSYKSCAEFLLAILLLSAGLPLICLMALLVRLTSRGPAIYRQQRVGRHGRTFMLYKLRTMYRDAEARTGPVWAAKDDPRVTPIGRFLRRTHLDELPQLFNVLKGEMALVGPRPERPEFVARLAREIPGYLDRLSVRPGITGLAQLYLPPDAEVGDVRTKLRYDLQYIRQMGPRIDAKLLICTALRLFKFPHRLGHRIVRLDAHLRPAVSAPPLLSRSPDQD